MESTPSVLSFSAGRTTSNATLQEIYIDGEVKEEVKVDSGPRNQDLEGLSGTRHPKALRALARLYFNGMFLSNVRDEALKIPVLAHYISRIRLETASHDEVRAAVERVEAAASNQVAIALLSEALHKHIKKFGDSISLNPTSDEEALELLDGVPILDERFAAYLDKIGAESAEKVRKNGRDRATKNDTFGLWLSDRPLLALARALWVTEVKERVEHRARNPPALVRAVHAPVAALFANKGRRDETKDGQRTLTLEGEVKFSVAHIDATTSQAIVDRGLEKLDSLASIKTARYFVITGHENVFNREDDARRIVIPGGYQELAKRLGINASHAQEIVEAYHSIELQISPGRSTRLLIRTYGRATKNQPAMLEIVLGTALLPGYVFEPHGLRAEQKQLVPIVESLPGFVGRDNEHGAQAAASMVMVGHFREHAEELATDDSVHIDPNAMDRIFEQGGVPRKIRSQVLERWQQTKEDAPAFLLPKGKELYTLADPRANDFIKEGGKRQLIGAKNGRIAAAKRRAR